MIYLPVGKSIEVDISNFPKQVIAWWFNPKDAIVQTLGNLHNKGIMEFIPPIVGNGNDWVLIIDDPKKAYSVPGTKIK
jgi:hypothetical protein